MHEIRSGVAPHFGVLCSISQHSSEAHSSFEYVFYDQRFEEKNPSQKRMGMIGRNGNQYC